MKGLIHKLIQFLTKDVWRIRAGELSKWRSTLLQYLRMFILAIRGFASDACSLRASALVFYTIMSIVPVVAMGFGIAKGFGMDEALRIQIKESLKEHQAVLDKVLEFSNKLLENSQGGLIAGVGVAVLLWTVIKVFGNIEKSFNHIWGVERPRTLLRKSTDYLFMMVVCPILLVMSNSITVTLQTHANEIQVRLNEAGMGILAPIIFVLMTLVPLVLMSSVFGLMYVVMPNTKVKIKSGIVAGIVAGALFQIMLVILFRFQVGVSRYSTVYGSFAALPLFLIFLQLAWLVVLFGAELSFAHQNVATYEFEPDCLAASNHFKRLISLRTAQRLVRNFAEGGTPKTATELSHELGVPIRLMQEVLRMLVDASILSEARMDDPVETGYQPARTIDGITIARVVDAIDRHGTDDLPVAQSDELAKIAASLDAFDESMNQSKANVTLKDI